VETTTAPDERLGSLRGAHTEDSSAIPNWSPFLDQF